MPLRVRSLFLLLALTCTTALSAAKPEFITRVFKFPSDYASRGWAYDDPDPAMTGDPFEVRHRDVPQALPPRKIVREYLEKQGVVFAEGARATYNPFSGLLAVTNTQPNLTLVEALAASLNRQTPATITCIITVVEGPGELIRQANASASRSANAAQELATLLGYAKNPGSNVRVVGDAFLETKSGNRATTAAVCEHTYAAGLEMDAKSRSSVAHQMRQIGLRLEIEPTLGSDGKTIDSVVSLDLHPAPPSERQVSVTEPVSGGTAQFPTTDIPGAQFITGFKCTSGSTKLIGITKPVGTPKQSTDTLWAAFLTLAERRIECLPAANAATSSPIIQTPEGMSSTTFNVSADLLAFLAEQSQTLPPWLQKPTQLQAWFESRGIKPERGAAAIQAKGVLRITNTPDNIERIASLIDESLRNLPRTASFTLHTIQAPAAFLRELTCRTTASADDSAMLTAAEAAVARGEARFINSLFFETKSGNLVTHESIREHRFLSKFETNAKGQPQLAIAMRPVGSILKIESTVRADARAVQIALDHELHSAAPEVRREHFRDPASNKPFDMPVVDFHSAKTVTEIHMPAAGVKLISLNRPTGHGDAEVLWATFLKCDLVTHLPKYEQMPVEEKKTAPADPNAWNTRVYQVPPDFTASGGGASERDAWDPNKAVKKILAAAGIRFPEGSSVSYAPAAGTLIVKNTNENLAMLDAYVESITKTSPRTVVLTTHILQGPGSLLRRLTAQAASNSDHRAELDDLLNAVKAGTVQHLNTARIETQSGTRATSKQASEHTSVTSVTMNEKDEPVFELKKRDVGLCVEFEPIVGADGVTIELTVAPEFHTAPPFEHREHVIDTQGRRLEFPLTDYFTSKITTGITMPDGTARLLSLYKPTGKPEFEKEDILQAIFITCDSLRAGE